jgi:acetyl-CoA/propionyl-CoA carboxylase carboxyl transferase subunit
VLADVPGYLPGVDQEWQGVVRRGAKLLHAFAEAVVPRVTLVTRKAFGGAYIAMNSRSLGATRCYAWAGAEVDVMGPVAAVRILSRRELAALEDPEHKAAREADLAAEHTASTGGLDTALRGGLIDAVLHPSASRRVLAEALAAARQGRGEHSNIPL